MKSDEQTDSKLRVMDRSEFNKQQLKLTFQQFLFNRQQILQDIKVGKRIEARNREAQLSFKPSISKRSNDMALDKILRHQKIDEHQGDEWLAM